MRSAHRIVVSLSTAAVLLTVNASVVHAQSAQKYAFQVAVMATSIGGSGSGSTNGYGIEPQLRFNRLYSTESFGISLGVGVQYTTHSSGPDKLNIAGGFIEPRLVPVTGSTRFFPYLSGRLALLNQSSNFGSSSGGYAFGGGAGMVVKLSKTVNLDAGAALVSQKFGDFKYDDGSAGTFRSFSTYAAKIGVNVGFPR